MSEDKLAIQKYICNNCVTGPCELETVHYRRPTNCPFGKFQQAKWVREEDWRCERL